MDHGESVPEPIREHLPISEERRAGYRDGRARHGNVGRSERQTAVTHSAGGHDLNRGVTTLRKFVKPNDQHQPEAKGTEPRVGADPFVRQGSVAPVEIVVPEDDEAAEFSGDTGEFDGDIY